MCSPESKHVPTVPQEDPDDLEVVLSLDSGLRLWWVMLHGGTGARVVVTVAILILFRVAFLVRLLLQVSLMTFQVEPASRFHFGNV